MGGNGVGTTPWESETGRKEAKGRTTWRDIKN